MNEINKTKMIQKGLRKANEFRKSSGPLAGVCGGLAEYTGIPPLIVRIATVIAAFPMFWVIIPAYILLAIFMPKANKDYQRHYADNNGQIVSKSVFDTQCENCGEMNDSKRNFCQQCSKPLY